MGSGTVTVFRKAFAWTAVPIVALSIVSTAAATGEINSGCLPMGLRLFSEEAR